MAAVIQVMQLLSGQLPLNLPWPVQALQILTVIRIFRFKRCWHKKILIFYEQTGWEEYSQRYQNEI